MRNNSTFIDRGFAHAFMTGAGPTTGANVGGLMRTVVGNQFDSSFEDGNWTLTAEGCILTKVASTGGKYYMVTLSATLDATAGVNWIAISKNADLVGQDAATHFDKGVVSWQLDAGPGGMICTRIVEIAPGDTIRPVTSNAQNANDAFLFLTMDVVPLGA